VLVDDVANGTLALSGDGSFTYTPDADFDGTDSFTYLANDGALDSNTVIVSITVTAERPEIDVAIGDAPERFSRLDPDAWRDAWTDGRIEISQKQDLGDGTWTPVNLGTVDPGTFGGSSLWQGDLGVSGRTLASEPVPQEIDGAEALRVDFLGFTATEIAFDLTGFNDDEGGPGIHESARVLFLASDETLLKEVYVDAGDGSSFAFDGLADVAAVVFQAGAEDTAGTFVPGALSDGASADEIAGSGFLLDSLEASGPETFIA